MNVFMMGTAMLKFPLPFSIHLHSLLSTDLDTDHGDKFFRVSRDFLWHFNDFKCLN